MKLTFARAGSLALQIETLQNELEGERQTISDIQSFSEDLLEEKEQMRAALQSLREDSAKKVGPPGPAPPGSPAHKRRGQAW